MELSQTRAKAIIKRHDKGERDLFNWCEEYKSFINNCVSSCVSMEWDYILKKSIEDNDAPFNYEDIDLFDIDQTKENILYQFDQNEEEYLNYSNNPESFNRRCKNKGDYEVFLNSLSEEEIKEFCDKFNIDCADIEIFEYWIIQDPLKYRLEKLGQKFLNGAWCRTATGQSISLDSCCINAFLNLCSDIATRG